MKSIQTESPEFFETSSQTNPRVHHTRAVCHESQVFCTHLAPKHRKVRAFQFQLPVTSFRTRAVIFDTQVQQACLPYRRSTHNPYNPAPRDKSDIRTRNFWSILRDENDEHVLELPIQDNEEDPIHQWTTTTQRRRKPQESHREQSPSQLNYLCKCCRQPFQVSVSQAHWFLERSLNIPKRCEKCREKQRQRKECLKTSHPARVIEYAHNAPKTWAIPPQSPSPDSETTSVTSSAHSQPKGRFWEESDTDESDSPPTPKDKIPRSYWTNTAAYYDSPSMQEELFSSDCPPQAHECHVQLQQGNLVTKTGQGSHSAEGDLLYLDILSMYDSVYFPELHLNWALTHRPRANWPDPAHTTPHQPVQAPTYNQMRWSDICDDPLPDLTDLSIPEASTLSCPETTFPTLDLPDIHSASRKSAREFDSSEPETSLPSLQSDSSSEDGEETSHTESFPDVHPTTPSSEPTLQEDGPENIFSVLATLCARFDLKVISHLYKFSQEAEWLNKGPDLSARTFIDICFDSSLTAPMLIRYLKSSHVPHDTVQLITHLKASPEFPPMQQMYSTVISQNQWTIFTNQAHSILQD